MQAVAREVALIGDVRGLGAMQAIELVRDRATEEPAAAETQQIIAEARARGVLLLSAGTYGNVVRFLVPLTAPDDLLDEGLGGDRSGAAGGGGWRAPKVDRQLLADARRRRLSALGGAVGVRAQRCSRPPGTGPARARAGCAHPRPAAIARGARPGSPPDDR